MSNRKLTRSVHDKKIAGVCGGIAEYFGIDATLVRVGYILASVFSAGFPLIVLYIILAFVIPEQ